MTCTECGVGCGAAGRMGGWWGVGLLLVTGTPGAKPGGRVAGTVREWPLLRFSCTPSFQDRGAGCSVSSRDEYWGSSRRVSVALTSWAWAPCPPSCLRT